MSSSIISIVIVNWNGGVYLQRLLKSIFNQANPHFECILVDNNSHDGSIEQIDKLYVDDPRFILIKNNANLGYCGGSNVGLRRAKGDFILTVNPDVEIEPDFLSKVAPIFSEERVGIVAPCLTRESDPGVLDSAGTIAFNHLFATAHRAGMKVLPIEQHREVFGAIGACAIYRKQMLYDIAEHASDGRVDFFDEDFFTYYDEHDLQIRARWRGWKALYCPELRAQHVWRHSVKSGLINHAHLYHKAFRNYYLSMIKNMTLKQFVVALPGLFLQECGLLALSFLYLYPIVITTKFAAIPKIPSMLRKRRKILSRRVISERDFSNVMQGTLAFFLFLVGVVSSERGDGKLLSFEDNQKSV